ncbi:MAG: magnesium transporter [Candidatus Acetothermia bacterium]
MPAKKLTEMHPADAAEKLEAIAREEAMQKLKEMAPADAAEPLETMDPWESSRLMKDLTTELKAEILAEMHPDDAVDILQNLPSEDKEGVLAAIESPRRKVLSVLLEYPEDTAGGIMSPEVIALRENMTVEEAINKLRILREKGEKIGYAYVTDQFGKLAGVLPLRDLALREPAAQLTEVMVTGVKTVNPHMDREEVARKFDKYDYLALPVVDQDDNLVGVVTVDDVLDVLRQEDSEDMLGMVGVSGGGEESVWTPWRLSIRHRLPWLVINLGTVLVAALVVGFYENTIENIPALAVFMPVIAGQGGNSGSQTVAILVRSLALGEIEHGEEFVALLKEGWLGLVQGLVISLLVGVIAFFWKGELMLASIVALAMILSMITAGLAGAAIPLGMQAIGFDPALSATIWMTTVTDIAGFFFLLGLATWLIS